MLKLQIFCLTIVLALIGIECATLRDSKVENWICEGRRVGEQVRHPENCAAYFVCDQEKAKLNICQGELQYDPNSGVCNWPKVVNCDLDENDLTWNGQKNYQKPTSPQKEPPTDIRPTVTNKNKRPQIITTSKKPSNPKDFIPKCVSDEQRFIAHPTDCTAHYICVLGEPILRKCPQGLWWDEKKEWCDLPENSSCKPAAHSVELQSDLNVDDYVNEIFKILEIEV